MNTTHTPTISYLKWLALSLVLLFTACNKNEDLTLIIEDGQPTISTLIVGQWEPTTISIVDRLTGEILETEEPESGNSSFWEFFEDGTFGRSDKPDERFHWQADEEDFSINIGDKQWNVDWLTKLKLRLRERMDDSRDKYYDFGRIGDFIDEGEEEEQPTAGSRIAKITATTTYLHSSNKKVDTYTFKYDKKGRISEYSIEGTSAPFKYNYEQNMVSVSGSESYKGTLNSKNCIETLQSLNTSQPTVATASYNSNGYLSMLNNTVLKYDRNNNLESIGYFEYTYTKEKNDSNIDLNCIISNCSTTYEYNYSHFSLFAPFGFYGKSSTNMIAKEHGNGWDYYYVYDYKRNKENRITKIVRDGINNFNHDERINTTTFDINYE